MTTDSQIVLQQTVHGYRSGHELLQSSVLLPPDIQRTLLVQSDLSGPRVASGFEEYTSGYPLEAIGFFVLARTWYAPEMERPGCVWTHSLLIPFAELGRLAAPWRLTALFRRPSQEEAYSHRHLPELPFIGPAIDAERPVVSPEAASQLIEALYGEPTSATVLFAETAVEYESLAIALWSQQWPRLRRAFRFCTGALATRKQNGTTFDLLVAPTTLLSRLARELHSATIVSIATADRAAPMWVQRSTDDLTGRSVGLREFLWAYGADAIRPREAWRPLVEAFDTLSESSIDHDRLVTLIGQSFQEAGDCARLKSDLFGPESRFRDRGVHLHQILLSIARTPHVNAFSDPELRLPNQARALWEADRSSATELLQHLVAEPLNRLGEGILVALCDAVGPQAAFELERLHRGLLTILLDRSPSLATSPDLWRAKLDRQREFLDLLSRKGRAYVADSIGAMLAAGARDLASDVAQALGDQAAGAVLTAIDGNEPLLSSELGAGWDEILTRDPRAVVDWLLGSTPSAARLSFAISHLDPHGEAVSSFPPDRLIASATRALGSMTSTPRTRCAGFMLAIGLRRTNPDGAALVALSYPDVYRAASRDALPYEIWRWLSQDLPPLHWYRQWDQCQRLSFGLAERFSRPEWPLQDFLAAARDEDALRQAVEVAKERRSPLITRLRVAIEHGDVSLTLERRRIIEERRH